MGEWLHYNFSARNFHTKKLCSRLYSIEIDIIKNRFLSHPLGNSGVTYALRAPSTARWKASRQLPIRVSNGVGHFEQISDGRGRRPTTTAGTRKLE